MFISCSCLQLIPAISLNSEWSSASKSCHITPILRSLHWLKITERTEYKLLSLTYKVLTTTKPSYLHHLVTIQVPLSTRSSSLVTLACPPTSFSLQITHLSYQYASPYLWNQLPPSLRQPHPTSDFFSFCFPHFYFLRCISSFIIYNSHSLSFSS